MIILEIKGRLSAGSIVCGARSYNTSGSHSNLHLFVAKKATVGILQRTAYIMVVL